MARHILSIKGLGEKASWLLVQQALGMPEPKLQTDFMAQRVALLMFSQHSLPERLCVSAAVRQMGGAVVYEGNRGSWRTEMSDYQEQLLPVFLYHCYAQWIFHSGWHFADAPVEMHFPYDLGPSEREPCFRLTLPVCTTPSPSYSMW